MVKKRNKSKVDNSIMNIWTLNDQESLEQVHVPTKYKNEFISLFGLEAVPYKPLLESWLNLKKERE